VAHAIKERSQEGKIISAADKKFEARVDAVADAYADAKAEVQVSRLLTNLNTKYSTRYELPGYEPTVIEGQTAETAAPQTSSARSSWRDRFRRRQPEPAQAAAAPSTFSEADIMAIAAAVAAMGKSTHDDAPTVIPLTHPAPGQGERPNGPPPPVVGGERNF
jgi:hypothetical protein